MTSGLSRAKAPGTPKTPTKSNAAPVVTFIELGSVDCIPCKAMQPIMEEVGTKYGTQVKVAFYDVRTKMAKGKWMHYSLSTKGCATFKKLLDTLIAPFAVHECKGGVHADNMESFLETGTGNAIAEHSHRIFSYVFGRGYSW